jgi:pimeloyl-ACP methyl ester carboxylesterase
MRQLAILLAEAGIHSLRFDYYATGDSAGEDAEGDIAGWRQDILTAAEELTSLAGVTRITVVGLRLGATLAAQASADLARTIESLVLWDPITEGSGYIEELYAACRAQPIVIKEPVSRSTSYGGGFEILGFPLTTRIGRELEGLSLAAIARDIPCPVHAVVSGPELAVELSRAALKPVSSLAIEQIETPPIWFEDWPRNSGVVPVKILQQIVQWVAQ